MKLPFGMTIPPRPVQPGKIIPPQGGAGVFAPKKPPEQTTIVRVSPYYYRVECDGQAIEVGFATYQEMLAYLDRETVTK